MPNIFCQKCKQNITTYKSSLENRYYMEEECPLYDTYDLNKDKFNCLFVKMSDSSWLLLNYLAELKAESKNAKT